MGRYALYKDKPVYVKALFDDGMVNIVETISKMDYKVHFSTLQLIEKSGVNVYQLN